MKINVFILVTLAVYWVWSRVPECSTHNNEGRGANGRGTIPGVQKALDHVGNICAVFLLQFHSLDPIFHHQ